MPLMRFEQQGIRRVIFLPSAVQWRAVGSWSVSVTPYITLGHFPFNPLPLLSQSFNLARCEPDSFRSSGTWSASYCQPEVTPLTR